MIRPVGLGRLRDVSRVLRPNYAQRFLLPPSLDDWVPKDHPVRFVSDFVDALPLHKLGIAEPKAYEGRPPYAPDLLLKVWLFGYMERIRSTRALEKACVQVMPFLWLTGNLHPDHNTLWRFFDAYRKALPKLFKELVKAAARAQLVGFVLHALDGTKLTAASSTDEALHRKSLSDKLKLVEEFIAAYMQEVTTRAEDDKGKSYAMPAAMADEDKRRAKIRKLLEHRLEEREDEPRLEGASAGEPNAGERRPEQMALDGQGPTSSAPGPEGTNPATSATSEQPKREEEPTRKDEPPPGGSSTTEAPRSQGSAQAASDPLLREAVALKAELEGKRAKLDTAGVDHLHEGEPEARMMKGRGTSALGYNAQIVVDHDSDLIVACDLVVQQNDIAQLTPMLEKVHETLGAVAEQTLGDGGYASGEQLLRAEQSGRNVLVRLREEPDAKGEYSKAYFRYEAESNVYICPRGERLVQIGLNKSHASSAHPDAIYRCKNTTCPVRSECTKDRHGRKIRRPYGEEARERQAHKQQDPRMAHQLGLRKEIVEHLFGIVKAVDGFRRFTVRGLEKASAQWALVCLAVNLRKLHAMAYWESGALVKFEPSELPAAAG